MSDPIAAVVHFINTISHVSIRNPWPRARDRFKNEIGKLPVRFAHAAGLKSVTVPDGSTPHVRFISSLSQTDVKPLAVLDHLADFAAQEDDRVKISEHELESLSHSQLYRLHKNLKSNGAMVAALSMQIEKISPREDLPEHEKRLLDLFQRMHDTLKDTKEAVAARLGKANIKIDLTPVEDGKLREAIKDGILDEAWDLLKHDASLSPAMLVKMAITHAKARSGADKERLRDLDDLHAVMTTEGRVDAPSLYRLLRSALRAAGEPHAAQTAKYVAKILSDKKDVALLYEQWERLYLSLAEQNAGSKTARQDLLDTVKAIIETADDGQAIVFPKLADASSTLDVWTAVHQLASFARARGGSFGEAVIQELTRQKFHGITASEFLLAIDDALVFEGDSARVVQLMRDHHEAVMTALPEGAQTPEQATPPTTDNAAKEVEASPAPASVSVSGLEPEDTRLTIAEIDGKVFNDYLVKFFTKIARDANAGEVISSREIDAQVSQQLKALRREEVLQIRDFFNRHLWIPSYFAKGDTPVEQVFGLVAGSYAKHSNMIMLGGREYEPVLWAERQNAKMDRFENALQSYGYLSGEEPDPSIMLQEYVNGLGSGREMPILFEPFLFYFRNEEKQFGADLLMVKNRLDYIEILSDIADLARSQAPDSDPETFRIVADSIVGSIAWRQEFVEIARKYSAIAEITPIATRAREESRRPTVEARRRARQIAKPRNAEEIAKALKADEIADAWRKADEIGIVGGSLRDRYGITPSPTREERQEFDRYRKRIADRNGDVYQALWELRADEAKRPARPRRVARIKARQPAKTRPAEPSPVAESPRGSATLPLSPRSRSTLDAIIDDLAAGPITETISEEEI